MYVYTLKCVPKDDDTSMNTYVVDISRWYIYHIFHPQYVGKYTLMLKYVPQHGGTDVNMQVSG